MNLGVLRLRLTEGYPISCGMLWVILWFVPWVLLWVVLWVMHDVGCAVGCAMGFKVCCGFCCGLCKGCGDMQGNWCSMRPERRLCPSLHPAVLCALSARPSQTFCKSSPQEKISRCGLRIPTPDPQPPSPPHLPRVPNAPRLPLKTCHPCPLVAHKCANSPYFSVFVWFFSSSDWLSTSLTCNVMRVPVVCS